MGTQAANEPKPNRQGFTIIETLIVLAVAGLILAIIFLAVPALKREARNNGRKHDAAFISAERLEYDQEPGVTMPASPVSDTCSYFNPNSNFGDFCGYVVPGMNFYDAANITITNNGYTMPTTLPTPTTQQIITETYLTCNPSNTLPTTTGATALSIAVVYQLETSGGPQPECLDSSLLTVN